MSQIEVRAYNVGFGDAVLVSVPDRGVDGTETVRHILIDVGNLLAGAANEDTVFNDVVDDVVKITGGTVDLYVMTHEHMDHVQGLLSAFNAGHDLHADYAWLTGSADPHYYDNHADAKRQKKLDQGRVRSLLAFRTAEPDPWLEMMIQNNAALLPEGALGALATADYVDHLRQVAAAARTFYIDKDTDLTDKHPFAEASLRVLAPHENTADYYGRRRTAATLADTDAVDGERHDTDAPAVIAPPVGVNAGAFFDLVQSRRRLNRRTIMEIDAAANNTSIVLELEWRGWRLLFPGDAEEKSWRMMNDDGLLRPVHFVKIAHHGSVNGTDPDVLDVVMPEVAPDDLERSAVVSTHDHDWKSVPDTKTLDRYAGRATLYDTRTADRGAPVVITFAD